MDHKKFANTIHELTNFIDIRKDIIVPIGLDGAVIAHLLEYYYGEMGLTFSKHSGISAEPLLEYLTYASSKTGEIDENKFGYAFDHVSKTDQRVIALDLRTKTGKLGYMLKEHVKKKQYNGEFRYAVLFDPNLLSDIRGSQEELIDEDVPRWTNFETHKALIYNNKNNWVYNIDDFKIAQFNHIKEIKNYL